MSKASSAVYIDILENELYPFYVPPFVSAGHDVQHVKRMIAIGKQIDFLDIDQDELRVAIILHNLDRSTKFKNSSISFNFKKAALGWLTLNPFSDETRELIADAATKHAKKDRKDDHPLLTALRTCDRVDRFSPSGILCAAAFRATQCMFYDIVNPFGYNSSRDGKPQNIYQDHLFVLEWYNMLPSDEARRLIIPEFMLHFLGQIRLLGNEISIRHDVENKAEEDIRRVLDKNYVFWAL